LFFAVAQAVKKLFVGGAFDITGDIKAWRVHHSSLY